MRAVPWQGKRKVEVSEVPDPTIQEPTDAIIEVTSTNICGSDLHLIEVLTAFMKPGDIMGHEAMGRVVEVGSDVTAIQPGDIMGHEAMGRVVEVGSDVTAIQPGDRVVVPFQMSCGHCFMCDEKLYS